MEKDANIKINSGYATDADSLAMAEVGKRFRHFKHTSSDRLRASELRTIIGFIIILFLTISLGIFSFVASHSTTRDIAEIYEGSLNVRYYALRVDAKAHSAHLSMRNLALSEEGDTKRINYYVSLTRRDTELVYAEFTALKSASAGSEPLKEKISELEALLTQWNELRETYIIYALEGDMESCRLGVVTEGTATVEKVNGCIAEITDKSHELAETDYNRILRRSYAFDVYLAVLTLIITAASIVVVISVRRNIDKALSLVDKSQQEQDKILDELMVTDENLRQSMAQLEHMAYHDPITQLPNRAKFVEALEKALRQAEITGIGGCVLFIDLDDFNRINDGYGHDFGDRFLFEIAKRLRQCVDESAMLARFGGDEFLLLTENAPTPEKAQEFVRAVTNALSAPLSMDGMLFHITASIGVSLFPSDGNDVTQILKNTDSAMYTSKGTGHNTFAFYNKEMSSRLLRKAAIVDILHTAVESNAIYMVYQPQVCVPGNRVIGFEALMRLKDRGLGFVSPAEFIPAAEDTRLIIPIGYWAIRNVIETDLMLQEEGMEYESMSVNISEIQLRESDFVEQVKNILSEYRYDPSRLHFEITESILFSNLEEEVSVLNGLRSIGIKIELDDFGTGYSSLNYIRAIPLDMVKIDKCFVDEIGIDSKKESLIDLIIRLAEMYGAGVVAEGVETEEQVEFFKEKGEVVIQGYYFSKPLEVTCLREKLEELNASSRG